MSKALHSSLLRKSWNRDSRTTKKTKYKTVFLCPRYWCIFRERSKQLQAQIRLMLLQFSELFPVNNSLNSLITKSVSSHRCGNRETEKSKLVIYRLTISTNPTDPPGMQCSWVYEVRLNPSLSLCRLTDTSVESANLHVVAINFQWFLFCIPKKNSTQYQVVFVYFIEGVQNYFRW